MPLTYIDTSALVKRYVPEPGSERVDELCQTEPLTASLLVVPEIASALARRAKDGTLSAEQRDTLFRLFVHDARSFVIIALGQAISQQAAALLMSAPPTVRLRSLDALHLASARWAFARARRRGIVTGSFVTADQALIQAAKWAQLPTINPED